jgi:transposase
VARCAPSRERAPLTRRSEMGGRARLQPISLSSEEQRQLESLARRRRGTRPLPLRARIVLRCRSKRSNREIARALGVTTQTVGKWRARFVSRGLRGLLDEPRSGAPRSISDSLVEAVLAKTLHEPPPDAARWSSRRLATAVGISQRAVLRIWHTFDLSRPEARRITAGPRGRAPRPRAASRRARSGRAGSRPAG